VSELEYLNFYPIRGFPAFESVDLAPKSATCFDIKPEMVRKISIIVFKTGLESLRSFFDSRFEAWSVDSSRDLHQQYPRGHEPLAALVG
jgi:hypothetical protein